MSLRISFKLRDKEKDLALSIANGAGHDIHTLAKNIFLARLAQVYNQAMTEVKEAEKKAEATKLSTPQVAEVSDVPTASPEPVQRRGEPLSALEIQQLQTVQSNTLQGQAESSNSTSSDAPDRE